jgi:hypothetical protein
MTRPALFALAVALCSGSAAFAAPGARVEVPIHQSVLENGAPRYWVELSIAGGAPIRAMLDTGSTGLRVLALEARDLQAAGPSQDYGYTSGARFSGPTVKAQIALGSARTGSDFPFQRIETIGCSEAKPDCPVGKVAVADYRIGGRGARGFTAILGSNMGDADAPNPLKSLAESWVIELPLAGSDAPGRLILNPRDDETAGFTRVQLDPAFATLRGGFHDAVPGCVGKADGSARLCGPMLLDSGAPAVEVTLGKDQKAQAWSAGTSARLSIGRPDAFVAMPFTTDRDQAAKLRLREGRGQPRNRISAGSLPFQAFAVFYDPKERILGLKPRTPDTATETP